MQSDRALSKKAAQGCKDSLRRIYELHKDHLLMLARALTGDRNQAEDIVHDVFVAFARNVRRLRLRTSLRAYLSVSVCNRVRDLARTRIRRERDVSLGADDAHIATAPDIQARNTELIERLRSALLELPLEQREVLLLRSRAGLPFKDIARHQGVGANTARARYRYGIDKLRSLLNSELEP
jgi:RNA polymerase sigma-70 factor (ECF subfamily)